MIHFRPLRQEHFYHPFFPAPEFREIPLDGVMIKCYSESDDWFISPIGETSESATWERTFTHFFNLFRMRDFVISTAQTPIASIFLWKFLKDILSLRIQLQSEPLSQEDLNMVFNDLRVEVLRIEAGVAPNINYSNPFTNRMILVQDPTWVNSDAVLNSTSPSILFFSCSTPRPAQEINAFIKHWLAGGLQNLKRYQIVLDETAEETINYFRLACREHNPLTNFIYFCMFCNLSFSFCSLISICHLPL